MKANPDRSTTQSRQKRTHASEQLEVQHRVKTEGTHASHGTKGVSRKRRHRSASNGDDSLGSDDIEQLECLAVLFGTENVERPRRVGFLQAIEHRPREHERAHL